MFESQIDPFDFEIEEDSDDENFLVPSNTERNFDDYADDQTSELILFRYKEFNTNTYRIIKTMIPGCMMQLCSHFTGGLMTMHNNNLDYYLERFAGAWIQSGWFLYLGASLALAIDRALTFVVIVGDRNNVLISYFFLAFSWIIALLYLVGLMIPGNGFTYLSSHGYFDWFYDKQPGTQAFLTLEMVLDFSILTIVLTLYFIVFVKLIKMRRAGDGKISSSKAELRILIIAVISFLYESTYLLWFFWGTNLLSSGIFSSVIVSGLWIFDCGLFSVATIIINGSIRRKIWQITRLKKNTTVSVVRLAASSRHGTAS
ncbi:hypothetical protein QR680_015647 [Steinernema hermaphroditum]|uniref:7TM GPCR serpentine receptor class x (Srx) domain-containing protein n=1 Tax=Steinernema hermaphroditum TaxID=289476 RepID=A0AA39H8I6_9BILA|nr:hypothetical protein QR680_015647 [Steinernema hermaphroditum]